MSNVDLSGLVALAGALFAGALFLYVLMVIRHYRIKRDVRVAEDYMNNAYVHLQEVSRLNRKWADKHLEEL